jgi:hypothetical protein
MACPGFARAMNPERVSGLAGKRRIRVADCCISPVMRLLRSMYY